MARRSPVRALRAAVFTAVCVGLSAGGHELMSGRAVPLWAPALAAGAVFLLVYGLVARECRYPRIVALMLAGEFGLHELFSAVQGTAAASRPSPTAQWAQVLLCGPGDTTGPIDAAGTWPGKGGLAAALSAAGLDPNWAHVSPASVGITSPDAAHAMTMAATPMSGMGMGQGPWAMLAVHTLAGLVCAWWLRRGEAAAFALLRTLATYALAPLRQGVPLPRGVRSPRRIVPVVVPPRRGRSTVLAFILVRRGPPGLVAQF